MVSTRGFEPPTPGLGILCSILLSYVDSSCRYITQQNAADKTPRMMRVFFGRRNASVRMAQSVRRCSASFTQ